ncbi:MAG: hypothetical protein CVU56_25730 [Deltaproteobacteria bacterium HGW-Deltaproteobacteria-14]|nr:MAG: hypothetical protein CVU56_25730 [Deltaproteobacteria bacterium HGW-Deltaproteobacteria-14]
MRHLFPGLLLLALALAACETGGGGTDRDTLDGADIDAFVGDSVEPGDTISSDTVSDDTSPGDTRPDGDATGECLLQTPPEFDDHTVLGFDTEACLLDYGGDGGTPLQLKFVLYDFEGEAAPRVHFFHPGFYDLHDEWSWFRLLNGVTIPGWPVAPVSGRSFPTIASIYGALQGQATLPLDLRFIADGNRLYSPKFYASCGFAPGTSDKRFFGVGSLLHYPANADRAYPGAFWAFELEYTDNPTAGEVERFFAFLTARLPSEVANQLMWLTRSPAQETLARSIIAAGGPYADRIRSYDDLVVDGEVVGYNPGVAAGYPHVFDGAFTSTDADPDDIVVLARVPDDIPPVAALISAVPQTPLAHVNLLAKARGTPNAYVGGILEWQQLGSWDYYRQPVAVKVTEDDVVWRELACHTEQVDGHSVRVCPEWDTYRSLRATPVRTITQLDLSSAPYVVDVTDGGLADMAANVPLIGGKCAGMLAFQDFPGMETPGNPLALSVRAYHEHLAPLRPTLEALLASATFASDSRVRFLVLEGEEEFRDAHLTTLTAALTERFAWLAPTQGLRFRSSATAEDVPGFNGAGLYDSNTGFLRPELQADADDRKRSVAWALKKTWSSYWGFPAFEERRVAKVDHLSGNMAVLVHPRFDDPYEDANGVMTLHLSRWFTPTQRRLVVNVQHGALSVTNPGGTLALPEIDEVLIDPDGGVIIHRVQASTEVPAGEDVLSDAELTTLGTQVAALADAWLDRPDAAIPAQERAGALVLDLEFKRMAAGWPALASGETRPRPRPRPGGPGPARSLAPQHQARHVAAAGSPDRRAAPRGGALPEPLGRPAHLPGPDRAPRDRPLPVRRHPVGLPGLPRLQRHPRGLDLAHQPLLPAPRQPRDRQLRPGRRDRPHPRADLGHPDGGRQPPLRRRRQLVDDPRRGDAVRRGRHLRPAHALREPQRVPRAALRRPVNAAREPSRARRGGLARGFGADFPGRAR